MQLTPYLLPTKDASQISINSLGRVLYKWDTTKSNIVSDQHLYLCSSESKINENEWFYSERMNALQVAMAVRGKLPKQWEYGDTYHKVILTTNPKLIADGVEKIDRNTKAIIEYTKTSCSNKCIELQKETLFLQEFCKRWNDKQEALKSELFSLSDMEKVAMGFADWVADQIVAKKKLVNSGQVFNNLVKSLNKPASPISISYNSETKTLTFK